MTDKNLTHYVTVTGILHKQGKYLIAKRADWEKAFPNKWTIPGGKLEVLKYALREKDTAHHWYNVIENLLKRECKEETNLEIKNIGYITSMIYIRDDQIPTLIISLYAEPASSDISLCPALTEYKWVTLQEAKQYDLIEGIYEELEILDKLLNKGQKTEWQKQSQ